MPTEADAIGMNEAESCAPCPRRDLPVPETADAVVAAASVVEPVRAGIPAILRDGPRCVREMAAALDVKQNHLSDHLAGLREAGLVRASRYKVDARWVYYERDEEATAAASGEPPRVR